MRMVYRIIRARDGAELYQGARSEVRRKLEQRKLRDTWADLKIESCKYEPRYEDCPAWKFHAFAADFMRGR